MNASRIPGWYAYPVLQYSTNPVEAIQAVRGRPEGRLTSAIREATRLPANPVELHREARQRSEQLSHYQERAFRQQESAQKGLFLNLLG